MLKKISIFQTLGNYTKLLFREIPINGQAMSLFRILLSGIILFQILFNILPHWEFLFTTDGFFTHAEAKEKSYLEWGLFTVFSSPIIHIALLITLITSLFSMLVGYRSQASAFIAFILLASLFDRNLSILSNAEILMQVFLLWSCFLPIGQYWSFDAARARNAEPITTWPIIPVIAIRTQIIIIYLYSALYKLAPHSDWVSGKAIQYGLADEFFASALGNFIAVAAPPILLFFLTWTVTLFQLLFSAMIYSPYKNDIFRAIALIGAVAMHSGFIVLLNIGIFPFVCFIYLVLLVPDHWIDKALEKRRTKIKKIRIFYDRNCSFCLFTAKALQEFCLGPKAKVKPADNDPCALKLLEDHNSWVVYGHNNQTYLKWHAVAYILRQSPLFWPLGYLSSRACITKPMNTFYDWIGANRHRFSKLVSKNKRHVFKSNKTKQLICLYLLAIMFIDTTMALPLIDKPRTIFSKLTSHTALWQRWPLFAPTITNSSYTFEAKAFDKNNKKIDITEALKYFPQKNEHGRYKFRSSLLQKHNHEIYANHHKYQKIVVHYFCRSARLNGNDPKTIQIKMGQYGIHGQYWHLNTNLRFSCETLEETT